jgi:antitoxin (DNA-binding transcriptional repressor) of toxin-antitoxin stability system
MREIGVRELKRSLSATLRAVGAGEQVRVTLRGRAIADIVPAGVAAHDPLRELVATGRVVPPSRAKPDVAPRLARADRSASEIVLSERDAER